jgi:hypothetical protein
MASIKEQRIAFGPEALSRFTQIIEEVASELVGDGVLSAQACSTEMRTRLAQKLLGLARFWWTDTQIKQLLLRTLRNQVSASRQHATAAGLDHTPSGFSSRT